MKKNISETDDWLRSEYDLNKLRVIARGRGRESANEIAAALAPDLAKPKPHFGSAKGLFVMADDFSEPEEDFDDSSK